MTPAENVSATCAVLGSPLMAALIVWSEGAWPLKIIALAALAGLLWSTMRRIKADAHNK